MPPQCFLILKQRRQLTHRSSRFLLRSLSAYKRKYLPYVGQSLSVFPSGGIGEDEKVPELCVLFLIFRYCVPQSSQLQFHSFPASQPMCQPLYLTKQTHPWRNADTTPMAASRRDFMATNAALTSLFLCTGCLQCGLSFYDSYVCAA